MTGKKLLLSFWLATAVFCFLQIVFGPGGLTEMTRLQEQRARLEIHLDQLKQDNLRLNSRYKALSTSAEAVRLEARALGWFEPGTIPVRTLDGAEFRLPSDEPDLSAVPPLPAESSDSSLFFRVAWPLLFLVFHTFFSLLARMWPQGLRSIQTFPVVLPPGLDFFRK